MYFINLILLWNIFRQTKIENMNEEENPFYHLFPTDDCLKRKVEETTEAYKRQKIVVNETIENIFRVTVREDMKHSFVFLASLRSSCQDASSPLLTTDMIQPALLMRMLYRNSYVNIVGEEEMNPYIYLFYSYLRLKEMLRGADDITRDNLEKMKTQLHKSVFSSVTSESLFGLGSNDSITSLSTHGKIWQIMKGEHYQDMIEFLDDMISRTKKSSLGKDKFRRAETILEKLFLIIMNEISKMKLSELVLHENILEALTWIMVKPSLGVELVKHSFPSDPKFGKSWESTLLGSLFSVSVVNSSDYFNTSSTLIRYVYIIND